MESGSLVDRVINVHTTKPLEWVLDNVFSEASCGPRKRVLFWKSDKPGTSHFFIEFEHKDSVARAQREAQAGVTVHCLARNLNMRSTFHCLASGNELPKKRTSATAGATTAEPKASSSAAPSDASDSSAALLIKTVGTQPANKKRRIQDTNVGLDNAKRAKNLQAAAPTPPIRPIQAEMQGSCLHNLTGSSAGNKKERIPPLGPQRLMNGNAGQRARTLSSEPLRLGKGPLQHHQQHDWQKNLQVLQDRAVPLEGPSLRRRASNASDARSEFHGPTISMTSLPSPAMKQPDKPAVNWKDPESLREDDVQDAISSLKASMAGPESWITVAASYRRRALYIPALSVATSMLEVMQSGGMTKADLKPALLLMAQCHYNIAKQQKSKQGNNGTQQESQEDSSKYFVQLIDWLRKMYGTNASAMEAISQSAILKFESSATGGLVWPSCKDRETEGLNSSTSTDLTSLTSRLATLTAELDSSRLNRDTAMAALATARASKLKLEGSLRSEEARRRSLERELGRVRDELHDARSSHVRMMQRETEARRRAEDRLVACERRLSEARADAAAARSALEGVAAVAALAVRQPSSVENAREFCETRTSRARIELFKSGLGSAGAVPHDISSISSTP